jgi:putative SOS response-associated peptidase YedK
MCGRTACTIEPNELKRRYGETWVQESRYTPLYNAGPQTFQPAIFIPEGKTVPIICSMQWGVDQAVFSFHFLSPDDAATKGFSLNSTQKSSKIINARSDSLKNEFWAEAFLKRRCVVFVNGYHWSSGASKNWTEFHFTFFSCSYFEWKVGPQGSKIPYFVHLKNGEFLCLAALFQTSTNKIEKTNSFLIRLTQFKAVNWTEMIFGTTLLSPQMLQRTLNGCTTACRLF